MRRSYQSKGGQSNSEQRERDEIQDALESYVREGAQQMLAAVLEEEVNAFLGRHRYQRGQRFRGYRNGYHPARELTVGLGPVEVRVPRVAQVPEEVAPRGFHSQVVRRYQRASQTTQRLFARLYLEGLATGDFEPVFRELVGRWLGEVGNWGDAKSGLAYRLQVNIISPFVTQDSPYIVFYCPE